MFRQSKLIILCSVCTAILPFTALALFKNVPVVKSRIVPQPFLSAPYFGTKKISSIFDHEYPVYGPEGLPPYPADPQITRTMMHNNGLRLNPGLNDNIYCVSYSGHDGIDYQMVYDYVLAAHDGTVVTAGWYDPNHRLHYGLYMEITIQNQNASGQYKTIYGHLSTLLARVGNVVKHEDAIAISGNTGNSSGPHLHFGLQKRHTNQLYYVVNPYGWFGGSDPGDPWQNSNDPVFRPASVNVWSEHPSIDPYYTCTQTPYPDGNNPIQVDPAAPPLTPVLTDPTTIIIDNDPRFQKFGGPWSFRLCTAPVCYGSSFWYTNPTMAATRAQWQPYLYELVSGWYDLYAYIPGDHDYANSVLAHYKIYHNGRVDSAGIDQTIFNAPPNFPRAWAYLGRYDFSTKPLHTEKVEVYHEGYSGEKLAADALAFVLVDGSPDLTQLVVIGSDDAGPTNGCGFALGWAEIYFGYCDNSNPIVSGLRFSGVDIPDGATISRAHLQFRVDGFYDAPLRLLLYGERSPNSLTFSMEDRPENRAPTSSTVVWFVPTIATWDLFQVRYSPNLAPIAQEITELDGWTPQLSAVTMIVKPDPAFPPPSGDRYRRVLAYERQPGNGVYAARLLIWYECTDVPPCPTD